MWEILLLRKIFIEREIFWKNLFFQCISFYIFLEKKLSFEKETIFLNYKSSSRNKNILEKDIISRKLTALFSWLWFYYTLKHASKKTADTHHPTSDHNNQIWIRILFGLVFRESGESFTIQRIFCVWICTTAS